MSSITTVNAEQFKGQCFFALTLHRKFGNRARVTDGARLAEYIRLKAETSENGSSGATVPSVQLDGKCKATVQLVSSPPLDALNDYMTGIKDQLTGDIRGMANKSRIQEGLYSVRMDLVQTFEEILNGANEKIRTELMPAFLDDYPLAIERARTLPIKDGGLGPLWNEGSYPPAESLRGGFDFEWRWVALAVPEGLPEGIREAAKAKLEKQLNDAAQEITTALRESFRDLIAHATERLTPAEAGDKPKIFKGSLIENLNDFITTFTYRNVMNDDQLNKLVEQAKQILTTNNVSSDVLRKDADVRKTVREQFAQIKIQLDSMITEQATRKLNFD